MPSTLSGGGAPKRGALLVQGGANMQRYATATYLLLDPCMHNFLRITKKVTNKVSLLLPLIVKISLVSFISTFVYKKVISRLKGTGGGVPDRKYYFMLFL